jgi:hypothetical protein
MGLVKSLGKIKPELVVSGLHSGHVEIQLFVCSLQGFSGHFLLVQTLSSENSVGSRQTTSY